MQTIKLGPKADLVYGRSGSTKTSQVGHMAEYVWEKYGKHTRLVTADPGGWQSIEHLVEAGIIIPHHLSLKTEYPLETLVRLAQGWWPGADGKLKQSDLSDIGAYGFEGMSTFSTLIMSNLISRQDIHIPDTPKESFVKDKDIRWGFSGRAHFGFIQQRLYEIVTTSNQLEVHKVLWTAHETDGKDNQKRQVYGPAIIGEAMTGQCGAWFGAMLHMQLVEREELVTDPVNPAKKVAIKRMVPIMFLRDHVDPSDPYKFPFMAKPRGPSSHWKSWPDWMEPNIGIFYKKLDEMGEKALAEVRSKVAKEGK